MATRDLVAEFDSFSEVLARFASRLSAKGILFEIAEKAEVGTQVSFEVRIREGFSVLQGEGEVVQVTDRGTYLRLAYLDQPSQRLLPKLLEYYVRQGRPLLELPQSPAAEPPVEIEEPEKDDLESAEAKPGEEELSQDEPAVEEPPIGLSLNDLEAEFSREGNLGGGGSEAVPAADLGPDSRPAPEVDEEPAALLVDAEIFGAAPPPTPEDEAAGDFGAEEPLEPEAWEEVETPDGQETEDATLDAGLSWLPEEEQSKAGRSMWITLSLILIAAALGAAFYFFVLKPRLEGSEAVPDSEEPVATARPATAQPLAPTQAGAETSESLSSTLEREEGPRAAFIADSPPGRSLAEIPEATVEPLTGVDRITWAQESGETVVTFWADGRFGSDQVDDFRVAEGAPRQVIRVRGIRRPFTPRSVELDSDHVVRIRVGLHQEASGPTLHFVADLVDGEVELLRTEAVGEQLRAYFSKAG